MKPHGLDCFFQGYLETPEKSVYSHSSMEAYIEISNKITGEVLKIPMRSFVNGFITILRNLLAGTSDAKTRKSSVNWSGSTARRAGMIIGNDSTPVILSDDKLGNQILHASVAYETTSFTHPYVIASNPNKILFEIKRLFSNNKTSSLTISELGLVTKAVGASTASIAGITMLSRDIVQSPTEAPINVAANDSIRFTFTFYINQNKGGTGGFVLNFAKMIYNLYMQGNQNFSSSLLVNPYNQAISNLVYSSTAQASSTSPFYVAGTTTQPYIGIIAGWQEATTPLIGGDERTIEEIITTLTYSDCVVSAITNSGTNEAMFTVTRTFTNNTANNITINRIGLLIRGESNGTALNTKQAFIAINAIPDTVLVPGQSYKSIYTFKVRA